MQDIEMKSYFWRCLHMLKEPKNVASEHWDLSVNKGVDISFLLHIHANMYLSKDAFSISEASGSFPPPVFTWLPHTREHTLTPVLLP